jgi:hypothetical protein
MPEEKNRARLTGADRKLARRDRRRQPMNSPEWTPRDAARRREGRNRREGSIRIGMVDQRGAAARGAVEMGLIGRAPRCVTRRMLRSRRGCRRVTRGAGTGTRRCHAGGDFSYENRDARAGAVRAFAHRWTATRHAK